METAILRARPADASTAGTSITFALAKLGARRIGLGAVKPAIASVWTALVFRSITRIL